MAEERKLDNNPKVKIANMEKILPRIEEKLAGRERYQAEYNDIKLRVPVLKKEFIDAEEKYIKLRDEISQTNKRAVSLYLQTEPSLFVRFYKNIQQIWVVSKTLFFIILILIMTLVAVSVFYGNNHMQTLSIECGFTVVGIILLIGFPKYRQVTGFFVLAMLIFIQANFISDETFRWTLIATAIAIFGIGLTFRAFSLGEIVEKRLDEVLKRLPESPDTDSQQPQPTDIAQKPKEKK